MSKQLILVRHAHRDKSRGRHLDNGLSPKGRKQRDLFQSYWKKRLSKKSPVFISSPKVRCTETIAPLADILGQSLRISLLLDEQNETKKESAAKFRGRVKRFLTWWKAKGPKVTVVCSHGDWIPEFLELSRGQAEELRKGDWVVVEV